jgi:2-polyprenyl-3-methyl-5-hydroxy-6-metoxy-1,4-benzoquinol methylase
MFNSGGFEGVFDMPYKHQCYYPMFKKIFNELKKKKINSILEVGCGTGAFAHLLLEKSKINYYGFDFSKVAIKKAKSRTNRNDLFFYGNATELEPYKKIDYQAIICTEVLEHVEDDLSVIKNWKPGCYCFCSVPNFDSAYHVRFFLSKEDVIKRYQPYINIEKIFVIKKPYLANISFTNIMRVIWWNRYRPRQLVKIIGL